MARVAPLWPSVMTSTGPDGMRTRSHSSAAERWLTTAASGPPQPSNGGP